MVPSYFLGLIIFVSPLIGIFLFIKFRQDETAKYIGALCIKPFLNSVVYALAIRSDLFERLDALYPHEIMWAFLVIIPESITTLLIVYSFRRLFRKDRVIWFFLIGDIVRWLGLSIEALIPDPFPEPYFYTQLYVLMFFVIVFPAAYSIYGLFVIRRRANSPKPS